MNGHSCLSSLASSCELRSLKTSMRYTCCLQFYPEVTQHFMRQANTGGDTITTTVEYSFQGKQYKLVAQLEVAYLTELLESGNEGAVHRIIARKAGLDTYSYAYEMMEMQPIHFSDAQGLISNYIEDGELDVQAYLQAWREATAVMDKDDELLAEIAQKCLQIVNLAEHPDLRNALKAAYQAGKTGNPVNTSVGRKTGSSAIS